ncbi:MAG: methylaspartate mutase subunit E [Peptococcaceae bacterium]
MLNSIVRNQQLNSDEFKDLRRDLIGKWPTLQEIELGEAIDYQKNLPAAKNLPQLIAKAKENGDTLIYPRGGVALFDEQLKLMLALQDEGQADYLPSTTDSYTRNEKFRDAENGIKQSHTQKRSLLNGFPIVNYGFSKCRQIIESIKIPAMVLPGTPFAATIAEVAFASGYTGLLGAGISDTIRFTKELSLAQGIRNYQYVDRLVAYYGEKGIPLHREQTGFLTGTLIPPGIAITISILDCLLAAEQGVKSYSIGIGQNLNLIQDVAALRLVQELAQEYLNEFGYKDMQIASGSHQWMGAFPNREDEAFSIICLGAMIGVLGNATHITTKTPHEAIGIPTGGANVAGLRATKKIIKILKGFRLPEDKELKIEMDMLRKEVKNIVNSLLEIGAGDPALGAVRGFESGIIDVPWAPNKFVANKILPVRDYQGAVRYLDSGNLPLPKEVREYHLAKLQDRAHQEKREIDLDMAIEDISEIAKA